MEAGSSGAFGGLAPEQEHVRRLLLVPPERRRAAGGSGSRGEWLLVHFLMHRCFS